MKIGHSETLGVPLCLDISGQIERKEWAIARKHLSRAPGDVVIISKKALRSLLPREKRQL